MSDLRDKIARAIARVVFDNPAEFAKAWSDLYDGEQSEALEAADAVLAVLDLDKERAEAQVEALREVAESLNTGFQDIPAWTEAYEEGVRTPEWMAGGVRMVRSVIDLLTARADRIAREAGIETGGH